MSGLISGTTVPSKKLGDKLYHTDINSINNTVNSTVAAVNNSLKSFCNVNLEEYADPTKEMLLQDAIVSVGKGRRTLGMRIRFLCSETHLWDTYDYIGKSVSKENWENPDNWISADQVDEIDGGEF
jgi:hypothetical protein